MFVLTYYSQVAVGKLNSNRKQTVNPGKRFSVNGYDGHAHFRVLNQ